MKNEKDDQILLSILNSCVERIYSQEIKNYEKKSKVALDVLSGACFGVNHTNPDLHYRLSFITCLVAIRGFSFITETIENLKDSLLCKNA